MILVIVFYAIAVENVIYTQLEWCWYTGRSNKDSAAHHNKELIIPFVFYMSFMSTPIGYVNGALLKRNGKLLVTCYLRCCSTLLSSKISNYRAR